MNSNNLEKRIEILKIQAEDIENLATKLIKSAPWKHYSDLNLFGFCSLPVDLSKLQQQVIIKYNTWYNSVYLLVEKYLPHQLVEFKIKHKAERGGMLSYDITSILDLNVSILVREKISVIEKFRECFTYQKSQLLSLKNIVLDDTSEQLGSLSHLEECLVQNIYDYLIKNPTMFHTKSRSISKQKKKVVKNRDNHTCQICEEIFPENELEVDHIFPHSIGGSNQITNLMALCRQCNKNKTNRLEYYKSDEGKQKLYLNIREFVKDLLLIHNFGEWIKKAGDARRKKVALIAEKEGELEDQEMDEYEDVFITSEVLRRPNIKLIETYLEFINNSEISSEDLYDRFNRIYWEVSQYRNLKEISEEEEEIGLKIIQTICKNLLIQKERYLITKFLEILYNLGLIEIFLKPLKSKCFNTFVQFYENKNYNSDLIQLLDTFGYFKNVEKEISRAINDMNYDLLEKFKIITFSAYKSEGLTLVKALQSKQIELSDSEDTKLKDLIRRIMKNIENVMSIK